MFYTIVPYELLTKREEPPRCEWVTRGGRYFEVSDGADGRRISRIVSTNPADYLDPELAPGAKFS